MSFGQLINNKAEVSTFITEFCFQMCVLPPGQERTVPDLWGKGEFYARLFETSGSAQPSSPRCKHLWGREQHTGTWNLSTVKRNQCKSHRVFICTEIWDDLQGTKNNFSIDQDHILCIYTRKYLNIYTRNLSTVKRNQCISHRVFICTEIWDDLKDTKNNFSIDQDHILNIYTRKEFNNYKVSTKEFVKTNTTET